MIAGISQLAEIALLICQKLRCGRWRTYVYVLHKQTKEDVEKNSCMCVCEEESTKLTNRINDFVAMQVGQWTRKARSYIV